MTMAKPIPHRRRVPMFFKLLVGCLVLAAALIVGGTYVVQAKTQLKSRGNYLQKAERRLEGYVEAVGASMTGTVELLANDPELREAVAAGSGQLEVAQVMHDALASKVTASSPTCSRSSRRRRACCGRSRARRSRTPRRPSSRRSTSRSTASCSRTRSS